VYVETAGNPAPKPLAIMLPNFREPTEPAPAPRTPSADKPVNLILRNTPVRQALMDIARQASLRMEMAEGLGAERKPRRRGVRRAALRTVAEAIPGDEMTAFPSHAATP
jgi:hypothetical protein